MTSCLEGTIILWRFLGPVMHTFVSALVGKNKNTTSPIQDNSIYMSSKAKLLSCYLVTLNENLKQIFWIYEVGYQASR